MVLFMREINFNKECRSQLEEKISARDDIQMRLVGKGSHK